MLDTADAMPDHPKISMPHSLLIPRTMPGRSRQSAVPRRREKANLLLHRHVPQQP
jgi:hypothetical protein